MNAIQKYTEEELIILLQQKQESGFSYLYNHYSGALFAFIGNIISDQTLAADALQETFIHIFRHIDQYEATKSRLYTWMLRIARNASIDMVRSKGFRQMQQNRELNPNVYEGGSVVQKVDHIGVRTKVSQLKEDLKQVLELAYFGGYTQEEISEMLNIPLGTVKTRVRTGLKQLNTLMQ